MQEESQTSKFDFLFSIPNLIILGLLISGALILVWVGQITWKDISFWNKDLGSIFFGSRTGEPISLGIGMLLVYYLFIGIYCFIYIIWIYYILLIYLHVCWWYCIFLVFKSYTAALWTGQNVAFRVNPWYFIAIAKALMGLKYSYMDLLDVAKIKQQTLGNFNWINAFW